MGGSKRFQAVLSGCTRLPDGATRWADGATRLRADRRWPVERSSGWRGATGHLTERGGAAVHARATLQAAPASVTKSPATHYDARMHALSFLAGLMLIVTTLVDAFETILLPRRINRRLRFSRMYYRTGWPIWSRAARLIPIARWRESLLSVFGPLSMLGLFGAWILSLVLSFALLFWAIASPVFVNGHYSGSTRFATYLYLSGTNYFTLGLGDVTPLGRSMRVLTVAESGVGLGFLAIIISYLPVLYQAFSRREVTISLMDARAGSPPRAGEFLLRLAGSGQMGIVNEMLREWELWCAEVLESHISFPALAYYRSQHANQSWLAALATILDSCVLILAVLPDSDLYRVQLTFAMARHALVDIALIFSVSPGDAIDNRLPDSAVAELQRRLKATGLTMQDTAAATAHLAELRGMYEPILFALAAHFSLTLPTVLATEASADNWQRSPWMPRTPGIGSLPAGTAIGDHFD